MKIEQKSRVSLVESHSVRHESVQATDEYASVIKPSPGSNVNQCRSFGLFMPPPWDNPDDPWYDEPPLPRPQSPQPDFPDDIPEPLPEPSDPGINPEDPCDYDWWKGGSQCG